MFTGRRCSAYTVVESQRAQFLKSIDGESSHLAFDFAEDSPARAAICLPRLSGSLLPFDLNVL